MIDHSSPPAKPVVTHVSETAVRYDCNCRDVTSARNVRGVVDDDDGRGRVQPSAVTVASMNPSAAVGGGVAPWRSPRPVDDCELAADAEVCWLLRHAAAATPTTPEMEPSIGGLQICGDDAPLTACVAPHFDQLPPYLITMWCGLRSPGGAAVSYRDTRRRPCLDFDKMQVRDTFATFGETFCHLIPYDTIRYEMQ